MLHKFFYAPLRRRGMPVLGMIASFTYSAVLHAYPTFVAGVGHHLAVGIGCFFFVHAVLLALEKTLNLRSPWNVVFTWFCCITTLPLIIEPFARMAGW